MFSWMSFAQTFISFAKLYEDVRTIDSRKQSVYLRKYRIVDHRCSDTFNGNFHDRVLVFLQQPTVHVARGAELALQRLDVEDSIT